MEIFDLLLILFISGLSISLSEAQISCQKKACPEGFTLYETTRKCYALTHKVTNKDNHTAQCTSLAQGAFVAAPLNSGENLFIKNMIMSSAEKENCLFRQTPPYRDYYAYFLGAETCDRKVCKTLQWQYPGGMSQKISYSAFFGGEPNCGEAYDDEFCLAVWIFSGTDYGWNDVRCANVMCAVCEFRL